MLCKTNSFPSELIIALLSSFVIQSKHVSFSTAIRIVCTAQGLRALSSVQRHDDHDEDDGSDHHHEEDDDYEGA